MVLYAPHDKEISLLYLDKHLIWQRKVFTRDDRAETDYYSLLDKMIYYINFVLW